MHLIERYDVCVTKATYADSQIEHDVMMEVY